MIGSDFKSDIKAFKSQMCTRVSSGRDFDLMSFAFYLPSSSPPRTAVMKEYVMSSEVYGSPATLAKHYHRKIVQISNGSEIHQSLQMVSLPNHYMYTGMARQTTTEWSRLAPAEERCVTKLIIGLLLWDLKEFDRLHLFL